MRTTPGLGTVAVHAGTQRDSAGGVTTPIHTASSYLAPPQANDADICYPRYMNIPTQRAAADKIAALEGGQDGLVLASGLAAVSAVLFAHLRAGDHAVFQADIYGGTHHLVSAEFPRQGLEATFLADPSPEAFAAALRPNTRLLYLETPTNPLLKIVDLEAVAALARRHGLLTVCDNTFATPINQRPLALGVDICLHSATKYLNGHSDLNCGAVVASRERLAPVLETAINLGATLNVYDAFLLERGLKTLALRVERHNANGQAVAAYLAGHPLVTMVHYPGLARHPGHTLAQRQMRGFGGMLAFELACDAARTARIVERLELIAPAVSLGGVESLLCLPARTSHAKMAPEERRRLGIGDSLLRLSCGIEDAADIIDDLRQALATL